MHYIPYDELGDRPNSIVDGAANANTRITLSHWPDNPTPEILKDDLSTQIVFRYLDRSEAWIQADAVSNNHFDEDGLVGIFNLINPDHAQRHRLLLIDVAAAGDFGIYRFREAARTTFVLSTFADPELSPLDAGIFKQPYPRLAARLYQEMLPRLPEIIGDLDRFRRYWEFEDAILEESEAKVRAGHVQIEEIPELDLAIVRLPESLSGHKVHRFTQDRRASCHPMALHNVIRSFRILLMQGRNYEFQYRYESWVQYISKRPMPRVDLAPLAQQLSDMEAGNGRWEFDGVDEITPKLAVVNADESRIAPEEFLKRIRSFLSERSQR